MKLKDVFNAVIGITGLALSLGMVIVAIAIASALISHGWPNGSWALDWTALAAIGGLAAGLGAFYAARVALKVARMESLRLKEEKRQQALVYKWAFNNELNSIDVSLSALDSLVKEYAALSPGNRLAEDKASSIGNHKKMLEARVTSKNINVVYLFGESAGQAIAAIVSSLPFFHETLEVLIAPPGLVTAETLEIAGFILEKLEKTRMYYDSIEWPE